MPGKFGIFDMLKIPNFPGMARYKRCMYRYLLSAVNECAKITFYDVKIAPGGTKINRFSISSISYVFSFYISVVSNNLMPVLFSSY